MAKISFIIFDFDGVLRDSQDALWITTEYALKHHGVAATRQELLPYMYHHKAVHKQMVNHVSLEEFEKTFYDKIVPLRPSIKLYPDAPKVIKELHEQGYKLGIASSGTTMLKMLHDERLDHLFDATIGAKDTTHHKPHPEPVLVTIKKLGCQPNQAVMIGDMPTDIMAAKAAKVASTIGITHGFGSREMLEAAGADYIVDSLEEISDVLAKINS